MYPAPSARFLAALAESHSPVSVVELHWPDGTVTTVPHTGGTVRVDRGQAVRRTATITTDDLSLLPAAPTDFLRVAGARVRCLYGIRHPDGIVETVPVFFGRLDSLEGDPDTGPVTIGASGLEQVVADDKFTAPYSTRSAVGSITSIRLLIQSSIPDAVVTSSLSDVTLGPCTWDTGDDRWAAVQELATAAGAEVWADPDGIWHVEPLPDLLTAPVAWEIAADEGGVMIEAAAGWSRDGMYNVVIASGENTESGTAPVSATAEDDDPTSPTYVDGPFGRVTYLYSSPTLTNTPRAQAAADALLAQAIKPAATADITSLPNPLLEPGDVIRAVYGSGRRDLHQVQGYTIGLGLGDAFTLQMIGGREDA